MRIAFVSTSGLDNASPRGRWLPLARELAKRGHEPHLLMLHPMFDQLPAAQRDFVQDGVHIRHIGQMHVYGPPGQRRYFGPAQLAWVSLCGAMALAQATIAVRPDVVHVCKPQPINGLAGWIAARWLRRPLCVDCDDYEAEANRFGAGLGGRIQKALVTWWEDHLPRHAQAITVNTRFLQARNAALGVPTSSIFHVPNGAWSVERGAERVESGAWSEPSTQDSTLRTPDSALSTQHSALIYVGTMSKIAHGVDLLIAAMPYVLAQIPDAKLLMVGDGDDRAALMEQAEALGVSAAINWVGPVLAEKVREYWPLVRCSVDPVYDSPGARGRSPLKIVESLAAGVPVVTGDVGDRREMVGPAGVIVAPGDAAALAEGICALLRNPSIDTALIQAQAARYTWATLADEWMKAYSADLSGGASTPSIY